MRSGKRRGPAPAGQPSTIAQNATAHQPNEQTNGTAATGMVVCFVDPEMMAVDLIESHGPSFARQVAGRLYEHAAAVDR